MNSEITKEIVFENIKNPVLIFGENDCNIKAIEKKLNISIYPKGNEVKIIGLEKDVEIAEKVFAFITKELSHGKNINPKDLDFVIKRLSENKELHVNEITNGSSIPINKQGRLIKAKSLNQLNYINTLKKHDLVFSIGPAGTGKTYLAVAMGIHSLVYGDKAKLILTRPVVEAGESLGFLPGDLQQKINPYLRPLFDALYDMMGADELIKYKEKEIIEVAPLAYMRGRTLNNAFIILDEAQNASVSQLKMFLTRLGANSKAVVTGDLTQIDLPQNQKSGLIFAHRYLRNTKGIGFSSFDKQDIFRHPLIAKILEVFDEVEKDVAEQGNIKIKKHKHRR